MSLQKIVASVRDRDLAYRISGAMQDLLDPPPDALTIFDSEPGVWRIEAYFETGGPARDINAELAPFFAEPLPAFISEDVPDLNWVAISQAALPPVRAGRFTVHGSHDAGRIARGPKAILIDAGEAFGTAHHATTLGCLEAIDRVTRRNGIQTVLDLGCGSGVLAIAIAKALPHADVIATDLDPRSIEVAEDNARLNGVGGAIAFACVRGLDHPWFRRTPPFDLIIANILAGPLITLAPSISQQLAAGGRLILSGILIHQAPQVIARYRSAGFALERHDRIAGWSTLTMHRI